MKERNKNIRLIVILGFLILLAVILLNTVRSSKKSIVNEIVFMVEDTASIDRVVIKGKTFLNTLEKSGGQWRVNGKYGMDASMSKVLLAVLHEVRVKRKTPKKMLKEVLENLNDKGYQISVFNGTDEIQSFIAGGNGLSISYFMGNNGEPFIVNLPGYDSYVSGIFEVSENDWRDRMVISTTWIGLKKLILDYPGEKEKSFTISSKGSLPSIDGIQKPDTSKMMNYIDLFQNFAVDQFIDAGKNPRYDSLVKTSPWATISVEAVSLEKPTVIRFFRSFPGDPLMPAMIDEGQMALFSSERIKNIFMTRNYFDKK
jgi:hypothetical protein